MNTILVNKTKIEEELQEGNWKWPAYRGRLTLVDVSSPEVKLNKGGDFFFFQHLHEFSL